MFVLPDETVDVTLTDLGHETNVEPSAGIVKSTADGWRWSHGMPPSSRASLDIAHGDARLRINLFVLTPFEPAGQTSIGDYTIGTYPAATTISGVPYHAPRGLFEVTEATQETPVSAHFKLRQFLCKQEGDWPKYFAPNTKLYDYLETILAHVAGKGIAVDTLHVMSGYRTPHYNASIDNVEYSRHIYGDAADVFIDADNDGNMDDIDGNGRVDIGDAELFAAWIREAVTSNGEASLPGGLGVYAERSWRGPFVHFDIRGYEATWTSR